MSVPIAGKITNHQQPNFILSITPLNNHKINFVAIKSTINSIGICPTNCCYRLFTLRNELTKPH